MANLTQAHALHGNPGHAFSKQPLDEFNLIADIGVAGDAHAGRTVKHRSRVAKDPSQPNLRQVHLLSLELIVEMQRHGFELEPGDLGENITTQGLSLETLSRGAVLNVGDAILEVTGLRNPCQQIENFRPGLLQHVVFKSAEGTVIRRAGIMSIVRQGGKVRRGDNIKISPPANFIALEVV